MIYNLDKINEMADGDMDFIKSVVMAFFEEVPEDLEKLEAAIREKSYEPTYQLAHKLKPNLDLMGMEKARLAALEIETRGKSGGDFNKIASTFQLLKTDIVQVLGELKNDFDL